MKSIQLISLTILAVLIGISCSKTDREINSEKLQQRGNLFYAINEEEPYSGKVFEKYENGQKKWQRTYEDGKLNSTTTSWFKNGQKKWQRSYDDGKLDVTTTYWYKKGQKKKEAFFKNGKIEESWKLWDINGELVETGSVTDIDGNTYMTVKIGDQWWMAENLKVEHYRNGDAIPNVTKRRNWFNLGKGAYCSYNNDSTKAKIYGYFYNWYAVNDPCGLAPEGWHIPSKDEWKELVNELGGDKIAGNKIRARNYWGHHRDKMVNHSHFSALPAGHFSKYDGFKDIGDNAAFWSNTDNNDNDAYYRYIFGSALKSTSSSKNRGISVRCIKD